MQNPKTLGAVHTHTHTHTHTTSTECKMYRKEPKI